MIENIKTLTKQSVSCLKIANKLALSKNRRFIRGDEIFRWTYNFIKENSDMTIFMNMVGIPHQADLESYFQSNYGEITSLVKTKSDKKISVHKNIYSELQWFVAKWLDKFDFIILFYVSFFDLSSQFEKYLIKQKIDKKTLIRNCLNLIKNPVIKQIWLFAFLEILNKIFGKLNLHTKDIKDMKIENIKNIEDLNMFVDAIDSELMDRSEASAIDTSVSNKKEEKKLTVEYFGTDLTKEVKDGFIDPIIWRQNEINQVIYTLLRKNKNNPLLIWEAGVGKTAIVEWLAQKIAQWQVPEKLKNKRIFLLDMGTLVAGTKYRWEFEARMKAILEEASDVTNNIILFIDELHTIIGAGWQENGDAAQMLKPLLARWKIKLIWATTFDEYQKHIEKDAALKRRFQEVVVWEPSPEMAKDILMWLRQTYEDFHGVQITEEAVDAAISLSRRYMLNKHLPDKALDIIDETCARESTMNQKLENDESYKENEEKISQLQKKIEEAIEKQDYFMAAELKEKEEKIKIEMNKIRSSKNVPMHLRPLITKDDIGSVLADKVWIPANIVNESELEKLKRLAENLKTKIIWQDEWVDAIVKTLTRSRLSVINKTKPIGSFLFLGPSGVGKTFLAKLIAKEYFGDESALIRIDMSEFMEKYSVSKLIGSPAGYVGYEEWWWLTESVRRKPYSVVLFDEIEKASTEVLNILLQILDEGHLKDAKWRIVDFKSTIIVMSSNIGSEEFSKKQARIWFQTEDKKEKWEISDRDFTVIKERIMEELKWFMTPELINRIDYKIIFSPLSKVVLWKILKNKLSEFLATRSTQSWVTLPKFTDKKMKEIVDKIYDPQYGARPVDRYIQDEVEPMLIDKILNK